MANIPNDLGNVGDILQYIIDNATETNNAEMKSLATELLNEYNLIYNSTDDSSKLLLPYNRKDAYSILEYLKLQAEKLSDGRWTDFSDSDIGTIFLRMMAYLADMNNYQTDKVTSELYLDTCLERASAISLAAAVGYEPRHYLSAYSNLVLTNIINKDVPNGTIVPRYSVFGNADNTILYSNTSQGQFINNRCELVIYEGTPVSKVFTINDISTLGRIILPDYAIGTNTINVNINGKDYSKVEDVRFISGELAFSVHISEDKYLYIQLPAYWSDIITQGSVIYVNYLLSNGVNGRVGKDIIQRISQIASQYNSNMQIYSASASQGGYNPETVDEMRSSIPVWSRTMDSIVTLADYEEVSLFITGISDVSALDYNSPSSGLLQPDDYYKVNLYVLPDATVYDAEDAELIKYRNTIIKDRVDWELSDMSELADSLEEYAKSSIAGTTITLTNSAESYSTDDIVLAINANTGDEADNSLIEYVDDVSGISDRLVYSLEYTLPVIVSSILGSVGILSVSVVEETFLEEANAPDTYRFIYDGSDWKLNGDIVALVDYGISFTGSPAEDDAIQIVLSYQNIVVHLNSNWRDFVGASERIDIYYKKGQVLTDTGQALRNYIDERRLSSIQVKYYDVDVTQPYIYIDLYMDKNNTNFSTAATQIKEFVLSKYARGNMQIGDPIFSSVIGSDILTNFDFIRYCDVDLADEDSPSSRIEKIEPLPRGFIDIVPNAIVSDVLTDKIVINTYDYQNRKI